MKYVTAVCNSFFGRDCQSLLTFTRRCLFFLFFFDFPPAPSAVYSRIRTAEVLFDYVDLSASMIFWGKMESVSPAETSLSVRLPVQGKHLIVVRNIDAAQLQYILLCARKK